MVNGVHFLSPVGENLAITTISHQFSRKLGYFWIQIVQNYSKVPNKRKGPNKRTEWTLLKKQ